MSGGDSSSLRVVGIMSAGPDGSDMWRLAEPIEVLYRRGYNCRLAGASLWGGIHPIVSEGQVPDVIVVSRQALWDNRNGRAAIPLFTQSRHKSHTAMVWDCDDDLWRIDPDRERRHPHFNPPVEGVAAMARSADLVTTSVPELSRRLRGYLSRSDIKVVPNLINAAHWPELAPRLPDVVTIGLQGSYHEDDWAIASEAVLGALERHPEVRFLCVGHPPDWLHWCDPSRTQHIPWLPYNKWPYALGSIDIGLAPLRDTWFNHAKSPIKWLEYSMVGAASIVSPVVYGEVVKDGDTAIVARRPSDWVDALESLITDTALRARLAGSARADVLAHWTLQARAETIYPQLWREAYSCLDAHTIRSRLIAPSGLSLARRPGLPGR